jgi:PAS domain-containing protein
MLTEPLRALERTLPPAPDRRILADAAHPSLSYLLASHDARAGFIEMLLQALPVGVAMLDATGHALWSNAEARMHEALESPPVQRLVAQVLAAGSERREAGVELRAANGSRRWLDIGALPVRDGRGTTVAALVTIADATARVQATDWRPIIDTLVRL